MTTSEIRAVRDVLERSYTAWAAQDADAFAALYTQDATVVLRGMFHQGREAVRAFMKDSFAGRLKDTRGVDDPQDIRIVGGDTAIVVSRAGVLMPGETEVPADRTVLATWVLAKVDGDWRVTAYSNTPA